MAHKAVEMKRSERSDAEIQLSKQVVQTFPKNQIPNVRLTIGNNSTRTYAPGEFRIGAIVPNELVYARSNDIVITELPDGSQLHMLPEFDTLFPGAFTSFSMSFSSASIDPSSFTAIFRVFTDSGFRDFNLNFEQSQNAA